MTLPDYLMTPSALLCAVLLDKIFGDPRRFHPLAGFGQIAAWLEARMNQSPDKSSQRFVGTIALLLLLVPFGAASFFISHIPLWGWFAQVLLLYFALGMNSLAQHARAVQDALDAHDLDAARRAVGATPRAMAWGSVWCGRLQYCTMHNCNSVTPSRV